VTRRMFRYEVPVDGQPHTFELPGITDVYGPLHVNTTSEGVEFWAEHDDDALVTRRTFQVFGTGDPLPDGAAWVGTGSRSPDGHVGHLYEVAP
jgi:hypothetical protein